MADGLNRVQLLGNLGDRPTLAVTQGNKPVMNFSIATSESYLDRNNVRQEKTTWHRVTVWGARGEALSKILAKGDRVFVEGKLEVRSYEKNGEKRTATNIVATNVILCGGRGQQEPAGMQERLPATPAPAHGYDEAGTSDVPDEIPF